MLFGRCGFYKFDEQSRSRGILVSQLSELPLGRGGADCPRAHQPVLDGFFFLKIHSWALSLRNPEVRINHFLVTVFMLGIMATFVAILVDQHNGSQRFVLLHPISFLK